MTKEESEKFINGEAIKLTLTEVAERLAFNALYVGVEVGFYFGNRIPKAEKAKAEEKAKALYSKAKALAYAVEDNGHYPEIEALKDEVEGLTKEVLALVGPFFKKRIPESLRGRLDRAYNGLDLDLYRLSLHN